ncbi:reductive dehalogenase [Dehalogenimonas etheniformans]|uniref:Reductive dehalogenase n=2 Tax=Dehalogenimonas etheniformans TaxID=1536648 RepID=A0A2P5P9V9_9CHLR|nr:reductive dehalogenase [Dehalogenimonas etheniformans]QNT77169.1 reductive dehalogenase [Dehalogenimonas etheniformans]
MSVFHSTVSRRDFMKGLGFAGVGFGGAALTSPTFHDLDEVMASSKSIQKRPWYVKDREIYNPTIDVDWTMLERYDSRLTSQTAYSRAQYFGKQRVINAAKKNAEVYAQRVAANEPGYTYRARALSEVPYKIDVAHTWANGPVGIAQAKTPEERGEPKWTGTPEEASQMLTAVLRHRGATLVGYGELDQRMRDKIVLAYPRASTSGTNFIDSWPPPASAAPPYVYEDVVKGYETTSKRVIPTKPMWYVAYFTQMSKELFRCAPSPLGSVGNVGGAYVNMNTYCHSFNFQRYLGYQMLTNHVDGDEPIAGGPGEVLSGVGEHTRQQLYTITPEYGQFGRMFVFLTDLPLAPTKPIDAGIWQFCHSCGKCAKSCPASAISNEKEPTWDQPMVEGKPTIFHPKGIRAFWQDTETCSMWSQENGYVNSSCKICYAVCPFNNNDRALVHEIVKTTMASTNIFNSFFYNMSEVFGYGQMDPEKWWDLSLPAQGVDTTRIAYDGGYRR